MRGLRIERAKASNAIDIYSMIQQASKDGHLMGEPTKTQLMDYYFGQLLTHELYSPHHFWYISRKGKINYNGLLHAVVVPSRWGNHIDTMHIDILYVSKKSRKRGVATKLLQRLRQDAIDLGIKKIEYLGKDDDPGVIKKYNPEKVSNFMRVKL